MTRTIVLALASLVAASGTARAGRTFFGWEFGTEVNPERMVEIETWISEENVEGPAHYSETLIWWGPTIGITSRLEAVIPIELVYSKDDMTAPSFVVQRWGGELRYRFSAPDPIEAGPLTALARVAVFREVDARGSARAEADVVFAYAKGRLLAQVDIGAVSENIPSSPTFNFRPSGGVQIRAVDQLRVGVEAYSEINVSGNANQWAVVGPSASWTHGRFWLATAYGIGLTGIRDAPRVKLGVQF
jgi:hypothetical protein